ncbi:hypothetical protein [Sphaerisporangium rhizosphaerae]|uniref:DUF559 domain-containing protein n=1 Tax=Sphaerisporangium rhizosphaerae TaxID=2269375 RepID=A0ABW2NYF9_9ACTN
MAPETQTSSNTGDESLSTEEQILAQTAYYLHEQGDDDLAALILDTESFDFIPGNDFGDWYNGQLHIPGWLQSNFTAEVIERIRMVLDQVAERHGMPITKLFVGPALPDINASWRQNLRATLSADTVTNHAARITSPDPHLRRDGFTFESLAEVRVYEALKRAQAVLAADSTIAIFPLPLGRAGIGNSWTPDFLITRDGKVGLIEVDGPHHRGRLGADATRDRHWRNSGIIHIERILVEETSQDAELDQLVRAFLKRLRSS